MTCIYNEGAAGTSLLDGHNVSIRVCVCVCWGGRGGVKYRKKGSGGRESEGETSPPSPPAPRHSDWKQIHAFSVSVYTSLSLYSPNSFTLSLSRLLDPQREI